MTEKAASAKTVSAVRAMSRRRSSTNNTPTPSGGGPTAESHGDSNEAGGRNAGYSHGGNEGDRADGELRTEGEMQAVHLTKKHRAGLN
jgi:hypothetical protein